MRKKGQTVQWFMIIVAGSIIGNILGDLLSPYIPLLKASQTIGLDPTLLNLNFFKLTIGFSFSLNLAGIVGIVTMFLIFRKM